MADSPVVGVLSTAFGGPYFGGILDGIAQRLHAHDKASRMLAIQTMDPGTRDTDVEQAPDFDTPVAQAQVDGYLVILNAVNRAYLERLRAAGKPIVMISGSVDGFTCPVVLPDNAGGTGSAVAHLLQHGHTRIAFVGHPAITDMRARYDAYRDALADNGIDPDDGLFVDTGNNQASGGATAAAALIRAGMPATAAVTGNDLNAMGLMAAMKRAGRSVPDDLAVIGFDDAPTAKFGEPGLASVRQPLQDVGERAADLLLRLLDGETGHDGVHLMPTTLVPRGSCGCSSPLLLSPPRLAVAEQPVVSVAGLTARLLAASPRRGGKATRAEAHAAAETLDAELSAVAARPTFSDLGRLHRALAAFLGTDLNPEGLIEVVRVIRGYARHVAMVAEHTHGPGAAIRVHERMEDIAVEICLAQTRDYARTGGRLLDVAAAQYAVSADLLQAHAHPRDLAWTAHTNVRAARLGVWSPQARGELLQVVGSLAADAPAATKATTNATAKGKGKAGEKPRTSSTAPSPQAPVDMTVEAFPPDDLLASADLPDRIVYVNPLRADTIDWGVLAMVAPIDPGPVDGRELMNECAALLTFALEYQHVLQSLRDHETRLSTAVHRAQAMAAARDEERALLATVLSSIPHLVYWKDSEGRYAGVNDAYLRLRGLDTPEDVIGLTETQVDIDDSLAAALAEAEAVVMASSEAVHDRRVDQVTGEGLTRLLLSVLPVGGDPDAGVVGVAADVTLITDLEQQLAQANRLEAIGQLAAGIAHEINTPVQFVSDNTRFLAATMADLLPGLQDIAEALATHPELTPSEPAELLRRIVEGFDLEFLEAEVPAAFDQSLEGLRRVAEIVRAMKDFSHPGGERAPVDLNRAIRSTVAVSRNEWKYVSHVETDLADDVDSVPCYEGEIKQVVLNLIVNAAQALAEHQGTPDASQGVITIRTRRDGDTVRVEVADNGPGMTEDVRRRIFEPFFTTKPVGKGTGQGLSLVHTSVTKKHGGTIDVVTAPGEGATFVITLPAPRTT